MGRIKGWKKVADFKWKSIPTKELPTGSDFLPDVVWIEKRGTTYMVMSMQGVYQEMIEEDIAYTLDKAKDKAYNFMYSINKERKKIAEARAMSEEELLEKIRENERIKKQQEEKEKAHMKRKGFTHRVKAVIHPPSGSDRVIEFYNKGYPSKQLIQEVLARSEIKDDYIIEKL